MSNYFENIKWLVSSPNNNLTIVKLSENQNNIDIKEKYNNLESNSNSESETDSVSHEDSDHEYDKIAVLQSPEKNNKAQQLRYEQIYLDLVEKEQLVRQNLNPDMVNKAIFPINFDSS